MLKKILFIGMPGSGKGAQAELLVKYGFQHISTGELIRRAWEQNDPTIVKYKEHVEAGGFLPDNLIFNLIEENIKSEKYVLDGAIRTFKQAKIALQRKLIDQVLFFSLPENLAVERLSKRNQGRADDSPEAIKRRLEIYKKETFPILDFLKSNFEFHEINASPSIQEVHNQVKKILNL